MLSLNFFKRPPARPGTMIFYNTLIKSFLYMGLVMLCILALRRTSASIRHMVRAVVLFGLVWFGLVCSCSHYRPVYFRRGLSPYQMIFRQP